MTKALLFLLLAASASAQTLESAYDEAIRLKGRVSPPARQCWTRGESAAADAAGMPKTVCVDRLRTDGKTLMVSGFAILAGGAQREQLAEQHPVSGARETSWATVFHWEAGKEESDEESLFQLSFAIDENGAIKPASVKPIAFHQCPERGCSYACGVTSVEFKPSADPTGFAPRTSY